MKDVIVIGAGIAGLSAGFELQKENIVFHVLDTSDRVGGNLQTKQIEDCLVEEGPYTFTSSNSEVFDLIKELELNDYVIEAEKNSRKRFIHFNKKLHEVPMSPQQLYGTSLLSPDGKKTLLEEFFIPKKENEETVEEFFSRRFGREVLTNMVQPFLCGVFAGDIKKLSVNAVFPKLKELELKYKSVLLGMPLSSGLGFGKKKHTIYSFKDGMEFLPNELHKKIEGNVSVGASDIEIARAKDFFIVTFKHNNKSISYTTNAILFATPSYEVKKYSHLFPDQNSMELFDTEYMPIATVAQTIDKSKLKADMNGFGFLCTKEPHRKLLGTIWTSSIFKDRCPKDKVLLNSFIGGAYHRKVKDQKIEDICKQVSKEVAEILKISKPGFLNTINARVYEKAIPQYNLGHVDRVRKVEGIIEKDYGLFFTGNYLYGISVNDTIKTSRLMVGRIKSFLSDIKKTNKGIAVVT